MAGYIQDQGKGILVADTSSLLSDVQNEYKSVLGQDMSTNSETIQGLLISAETTARASVVKNNAEVANQINPNIANGVFLDSICALMDIKRPRDAASMFYGIEITGVVGTTVKEGSRCRTQNGDVVRVSGDVTIPVSGVTTANFISQEPGDIPLGTPDVPWTIIDGVIGWGSATPRPSSSQVPGTVEYSNNQLRILRRTILANQGRQSVRAIKARLGNVSGVSSVSIRENNKKTAPITIDGVNFTEPNSIWVCVDGGSDNDIVEAMMEAKSCGSAWDYGTNNGTPVDAVFVEPASGQSYPIKFSRGLLVNLWCRASVVQTNSVDNPQTSCQDAILAWAAGKNQNEPGLVLGADFSAFEVAGAISVGVPGMYVKSAEVSLDGTTWSSEIPMALWQRGNLPRGNITITVVY